MPSRLCSASIQPSARRGNDAGAHHFEAEAKLKTSDDSQRDPSLEGTDQPRRSEDEKKKPSQSPSNHLWVRQAICERDRDHGVHGLDWHGDVIRAAGIH